MLNINELLIKTKENSFSELHLSVGTNPLIKKENDYCKIDGPAVTKIDIETAFKELCPLGYNEYLQNNIFFGMYSAPSIGRYNLYAFTQRNSPVLIFKEAYKNINNITTRIRNIKDFSFKPGITILAGDNKRKEVAVTLINSLLDEDKIIMTAEDSIIYPLKHRNGYIFQCEKDQDFKTIEDFMRTAKRVTPDILYVEYSFDYKIMSRIFNLAANGMSIIINMPYIECEAAVENILEILKKDHNTAAKCFINQYICLSSCGEYEIKKVRI